MKHWSKVAAAAFLAGVLPAASAAAQDSSGADTERQSPLCSVYAVERAEGAVKDLYAGCQGHGLMLGPVTEFAAITNAELLATLIDARLGSERRVLLLSVQADGLPIAEDLTSQIAYTAGRGPMSELDGVGLDLSGFSSTGEIGVTAPSSEGAIARADRIVLGQQIAFGRARRANVSTQIEQ